MPEGVHAKIGIARREPRIGAFDELSDLRHRNRDVMLDVGELGLRHRLADAPERARLLAALRERGIGDGAALGGVDQCFLDLLAQRALLAAVGDLDQHVPRMRRRERVLRTGSEGDRSPRSTGGVKTED